ncbi:MAG TPA: VWA domain-containing protein [Pyrinomonadaceae bacterium]|nr:VWA domain-containing protein [Pyrinomonadaceae bacterium]
MFVFSGSYLVKASARFGLTALFCAAVFLGFSTAVSAQDDILKTDTSVVQLNVGVVDRQGRAITSLSQGDFAIYEDDVKRPIVAFEPTQSPFSLVMLLDMSGSTVNFRQQIHQAAIRFLDALAPEDRVAVIVFNGKGVRELSGFTTDRQKTAYSITLASGSGDTLLFDGLKEALRKLAAEGKRRKAIVALTDGLDTEVRKSDRAAVAKATEVEVSTVIKPEAASALVSVLADADRQGVTIFPLALPSGDARRLPLPDPRIIAQYSAARTRLQMMADRTGGQVSDIRRLDQMARVYAELAAHLRTLYSIAYQAPNPDKRDGLWRAIRVDVTRPDLIAKTKTGYYAK